tara:strand:- start:616 stop:957 length:342 start_codon:yes stop_codon:yes gene_type:complete
MENDNKLIAEFMGMNYGDPNDNSVMIQMTPQGNEVVPINSMEYHSSWDWLMPVVEEIEGLGIVSFEKNLQEEGDYQCLFTKGYDILICHYADTSIEATYNAVIEFINYYNKLK